jgi:DNA-binding transcriptional ArsR family regulator
MLNHMVESVVRLDRVFRALASEPRREILRRAARARCTVTELADQFDMTLAAVSKHVRVLDEARLLTREQDGRRQWRRLNPAPLEAAQSSIAELQAFWNNRLDSLERFLRDDRERSSPKRRRRQR